MSQLCTCGIASARLKEESNEIEPIEHTPPHSNCLHSTRLRTMTHNIQFLLLLSLFFTPLPLSFRFMRSIRGPIIESHQASIFLHDCYGDEPLAVEQDVKRVIAPTGQDKRPTDPGGLRRKKSRPGP